MAFSKKQEQMIAELFRLTRKANLADVPIVAKGIKTVVKRPMQQMQMSLILGVTQGTISKIEAASMQPNLELLFGFCDAFNYDIAQVKSWLQGRTLVHPVPGADEILEAEAEKQRKVKAGVR